MTVAQRVNGRKRCQKQDKTMNYWMICSFAQHYGESTKVVDETMVNLSGWLEVVASSNNRNQRITQFLFVMRCKQSMTSGWCVRRGGGRTGRDEVGL